MKVVNVKTYGGHDYVLCDRSTPLGNPFEMVDGLVSRDKAVNAYALYLLAIITYAFHPADVAEYIAEEYNMIVSSVWSRHHWTFDQVFDMYSALRDDDVLACHCAPQRCHCDIIVSLKQGKEVKMTTPTERIKHIENLLTETMEHMTILKNELNLSGAAATADRHSVQQASTEIVQSVVNKTDILGIVLNTFSYQGDKVMLKGMVYVGDGTDTPYQLPCVIWEGKPNSKVDYSGIIEAHETEEDEQNADRIGGVWLRIQDDGSIKLSVKLEVEAEIAGNYNGTLSAPVAGDFDYVGTATKSSEVSKKPTLAKLKTAARQQAQQQMMPTSSQPAPEPVQEAEPAPTRPRLKPLLSRS